MNENLNIIRVTLGKRSYNIVICNNKISQLGNFIKHLGISRDAVVITNPLIKKLFGNKVRRSLVANGFNVRFETVPDTEKAKSENQCIRLLNSISRFDSTRKKILIVALGGGVVGDLAGFVASIYRRGVPYIQVPTTLLAQVDSAIGGKVAIDLKLGKNLAGAFYQPRLVFTDISFLGSLPKRDLISGMAEVIKYGVIKSPRLFRFLEYNYNKAVGCDKKIMQDIVYICSSIKAEIVKKDEEDNKNIRVILNFGHTIGHAIEAASNYSKLYNHGRAVALGMLAASYISNQMRLLDKKTYLRIKNLVRDVGLPTAIKDLNIKDILSAQEHDKKFIHGKNRFVLPVRIGKVILKEGISKSLVKKSILSLSQL